MKLQFFTIPAQWPEQAQQQLNAFCGQHRVMAIEKQFVDAGLDSYWAICVTFLEGANFTGSDLPGSRRDRIDYKDVLSEQEFEIYAQLRNLRKSLSEQEGVPAYALFTNEQLAAMVTRKVKSETDMSKIEGVGKARLEKYGQAFLHILNTYQTHSEGKNLAPPSN